MFSGNPQKTGLNTSQYDFKGVAVIIHLSRRDHLPLPTTNRQHREQAAMWVQLQEDPYPIEA